MEQKKQLQIAADEFNKWYGQLLSAETFEQADEAKVEGLKSWIKYTQQLNRVRLEFLELATDTRARLSAEMRNRVKELTQPATPVPSQKSKESMPVSSQKSKESKATKRTKKAKK